MAPNAKEEIPLRLKEESSKPEDPSPRKYEIMYRRILVFTYFHIGGLYGLYLSTVASWSTILFNIFYYMIGGWGVTVGTHRLWSHHSFKAKLPLEIMLMLFQSSVAQHPAKHWALDHRSHHKFCDTDGDPSNSSRGFFYSHIGWLLVETHPEVIEKRKRIDMSDLDENPVLQFQEKYYYYLVMIFTFLLPTLVPVYFWQESLNTAYHMALFRLLVGYHMTFLINSAAHKYGYRPYDKNIKPAQIPWLSVTGFGEGYHNYHHTFPWDYKISELGHTYLNLGTNFIDFFAWIGWAYDLKHVPEDLIAKKMKGSGDGTDLWGRLQQGEHGDVWGWGDEDMGDDEKKCMVLK